MHLPFELWGRIFCQLRSDSLIQLLRVCQAWRDIANATPELWRFVHIRYPHQFANPPGLSQWLKKSGEYPLDVVLNVPLEITELRPTLALLHDHVTRFRILDIVVPAPDIVRTILSPTDGISRGKPAPLLEELCIAIEMDPTPTYEEYTYFEHAFSPSPRLRSFTFSALTPPPPSSKLLSTVAVLTITSGPEDQPPSVPALLDAIAAIPHLERLKYTGYEVFSYQTTSDMDYPRTILLPHLEAADVTVPGCGLDILQNLESPTLRSVRLDGWREEEYAEDWIDGIMTEVSAVIKRLPHRAPCIRRLDLNHLEYLHPDTYRWLFNQTDFTHLEELRIEGSSITDLAFSRPSPYGPRLRRLELRGCENITGNALIGYIKARELTGHADFQLSISRCPGVGDEHLAQLSHLVTVEDTEDQ